MKTIKLSILCALFITSSAFADMNGTYKVLKDDCNPFVLSTVVNAVVRATDTKLQVGVIMGNRFIAAFDYTVGTVRVACAGNCYYMNTGTYSADGNHFREVFNFATVFDQPLVYKGEVNFSLAGDELTIQNFDKDCILQKKR